MVQQRVYINTKIYIYISIYTCSNIYIFFIWFTEKNQDVCIYVYKASLYSLLCMPQIYCPRFVQIGLTKPTVASPPLSLPSGVYEHDTIPAAPCLHL